MLASKLVVHHMLSVGQTCHDKKLQQQSAEGTCRNGLGLGIVGQHWSEKDDQVLEPLTDYHRQGH